MTDDELLTAWESLILPHEQWTQRAHLRVAFTYLRRHSFAEALEKMRAGIKAFNASHNVPESPESGYNETTTRAFMHLIFATMNAYENTLPTQDADAFCDAHPQLLTRHCLRFFYSPSRSAQPLAKTEFIEPDLTPLPPPYLSEQIGIERTSPDAPEAILLISELEQHLASLYAPESRHGFSLERLIAERVDFFVLSVKGAPAGCGGIKFEPDDYGEIKRMYVRPSFRALGLGKQILDRLENFARDRGTTLLRLETGVHQTSAIRLYERAGFRRIPLFGPYVNSPESLCFEKQLPAS